MVNLSKGQRVSLDKGMRLCLVGLGWDPNRYRGSYDFDLDASVFLLGPNGRVRSDEDFVFYGNQVHKSGSVKSLGDDRTGGNSEDGDDEQIIIDLSRVPSYVTRIAVTVTIYDAQARRQNFGQVSNAYVRVVKIRNEGDEDGYEVVRYDLDEEFADETAIVACEISRNGSEWKFSAVGAGYRGELAALCRKFGVDV
ncbi:MAG: TerD family protein [Clostridia bacterium]|nr:TerD family protein [Clostridia bacterium]